MRWRLLALYIASQPLHPCPCLHLKQHSLKNPSIQKQNQEKTKYQLWSGQEFQNLTKKSGLILDDISLVSVGVCSKSVVDLGNGPNKPNATIIGEYSPSYHMVVHSGQGENFTI